ncbi:MAG: polysaccharide biosynthesis/export family protein [Pyrinomonadaceae bacterium]
MMARFDLKVFLLLVLGCVAFVSAQSVETQKPNGVKTQPVSFPVGQMNEDSYRIGFQDTLDIQIFRHPELAQKVSVNSNGTINLFKIPEPIAAVCKTVRELATDVAAAYRKDYLRNPEVTVFAVEQRSQAFAVVGRVEKPGSYFINERVSLLKLLAHAGGPSKDAGSRVMVVRTGSTSSCRETAAPSTGTEEFFSFRISDILEGKQTLVMQPGDVVSVLVADIVYVYGNVNKQGQVIMREPITLTQAITSSEGLKPSTKTSNVRILRQKPGSLEREEFVYDLNAIDKRKMKDPYLEPNDIVAVSEDKVKSILNGIKSSLTQGLPSIFYRVP